MRKIVYWSTLVIGALIILMSATFGLRAAIQSINGLAVAQTATKWNNLKDAAVGDNITDGVGVLNPYLFDGTNFDRARGDSTNGMDVDVTRLPTNSGGATTPSDAFANPTTALTGFSLLGGFNGTTWDRVRTLANNADNVAASSLGNLSSQAFNYEFDGTTYDRVRNQFVQSTTGVTGNAAGTTVDMTTTPMAKFTMVIDRTAGTTDTVEVDLQCSINNTAFVQIATITDLTNEPALTSAANIPCAYARYNVVTVGSGNTLAIDLLMVR